MKTDLFERLFQPASEFCMEETGSRNLGEIWLCNDDDVTTKVKKSVLVSPASSDEFLKELFEGGPSWVHMNIIKNTEFSLLALRAGQKVGNPSPTINMSWSTRQVTLSDE